MKFIASKLMSLAPLWFRKSWRSLPKQAVSNAFGIERLKSLSKAMMGRDLARDVPHYESHHELPSKK